MEVVKILHIKPIYIQSDRQIGRVKTEDPLKSAFVLIDCRRVNGSPVMRPYGIVVRYICR